MQRILPVILCGGNGTRLKNILNKPHPKQFTKILCKNKFNLLQNTLLRIKNQHLFYKPLILSNIKYYNDIQYYLNEVKIKSSLQVFEPFNKNTGAAIAVLMAILQHYNYDHKTQLLILPIDHYIANTKVFISQILNIKRKIHNHIILFGIKPTRIECNYGYFYISSSPQKIQNFVEKPQHNIADKLIESGYLWNSGIFLGSIKTFMAIYQNTELLYQARNSISAYGRNIILNTAYAEIDNISLDQILMRNKQYLYGMKLKTFWEDLGLISSIQNIPDEIINKDLFISDIFNNTLDKGNSTLKLFD